MNVPFGSRPSSLTDLTEREMPTLFVRPTQMLQRSDSLAITVDFEKRRRKVLEGKMLNHFCLELQWRGGLRAVSTMMNQMTTAILTVQNRRRKVPLIFGAW